MPAIDLSLADLAALANWLRAAWGHRAAPVSAAFAVDVLLARWLVRWVALADGLPARFTQLHTRLITADGTPATPSNSNPRVNGHACATVVPVPHTEDNHA